MPSASAAGYAAGDIGTAIVDADRPRGPVETFVTSSLVPNGSVGCAL
jgi:hypothetical protein